MDFCCQDGNDIFHIVLFFPHEFSCLLTKQSLMLPEQKPALSVLCAWLSKKKKKKKRRTDALAVCQSRVCSTLTYRSALSLGGGGSEKGGRQPDYSSDLNWRKKNTLSANSRWICLARGRTSLGPESSDEH